MNNIVKKFARSPLERYSFSVIIPSWNNKPYLELCVNSILKNSALAIQIIVFVNEGSDDTLAWLHHQKEVDYIHAADNVGICYALNACREMIKADYLIYLNDDMYVLPNWDLIFQKEIEQIKHPYFMLSATMIEPVDTGNDCVIVKNFGTAIENFQELNLLSAYRNLHKADWCGSTWPPSLVSLEMWDRVGGLSIEFSPGMYSDPDFSKKLYEAGVRIFKGLGKSKVYHFGSKTTQKLKSSRGRELFLLKWGMTANTFLHKVLRIGKEYQVLPKTSNLVSPTLISKIKSILALSRR